MPDDITFEWQLDGECHRPHSSPEYVPHSESGTVVAEDVGDALLKIITGQGAPLTDTIEWLVDTDRPITIQIQRADHGAPDARSTGDY